MISLPNGCRCSDIKVFPDNWLEKEAPMDKDWFFFYRFYLPQEKGQLVIVKGMNHLTGLVDRRDVTRSLVRYEKERLRDGYIPPAVSKKLQKKGIFPEPAKETQASNPLEILPDTAFISALDRAFTLLEEKPTKNEVRKALVHINRAIEQAGYASLKIGDVRQHHLEVVLLQIGINKKAEYDIKRQVSNSIGKKPRPSRMRKKKRDVPTEWGVSGFNHYRSYLLMLFKQIKKVGGTEVKPVDDIEKKKGIKPKRVELSDRRLEEVLTFLKDNYYTFYRFVRIFYKGGARITEIMNVKRKDVNLEESFFWVLVKKGRGEQEWKRKTITRDVVELWQDLLTESTSPDQYIFSEDLRPGAAHISPRQITTRWYWHVKTKLGLEEDIYWLRHKNSTKVIDIALARIDEATAIAAKINGHNGLDMSKKVYDLKSSDRLHQEILRLDEAQG